jgi:Tfp pilus assembly protein PilN
MFNLLSLQDKRELTREFRLRAAAIALFLFSALALTGAASLAPSLFLLTEKEDIARRQIDVLSSSSSAEESARVEKSISTIDERLALLAGAGLQAKFSSVINGAVSVLPQGVALDRISVSGKSEQSYEVSFSGVAKTRSSLVTFAHSLEGLPFFSSATLPVSYLAKDTDISFTISAEGKHR